MGVLDLGLLSALQDGIGLDLGDVSVTGSSTAPGVATSPATTGPAPAAPAAIPNVTSVHTGEFWAGTLPVVVMAGAGLAGLVLIGRRRIAALARSLTPTNRRRGGP